MASINDTVRVRRGGAFLTISKDLVDRYMAKGFDVVDDNGKVLKASVPNDVATLQKAFEEHVARIKELETKLAEAQQEINKLKAQPVKHSKLFGTNEVEEEKTEEVEEEKPVEPVEKKTSKRSKKSV